MFIAHGTPELLFACRPAADVVVLTQSCEDVYTIKMHTDHLTEKCLTFLKIGNKQVIFFLMPIRWCTWKNTHIEPFEIEFELQPIGPGVIQLSSLRFPVGALPLLCFVKFLHFQYCSDIQPIDPWSVFIIWHLIRELCSVKVHAGSSRVYACSCAYHQNFYKPVLVPWKWLHQFHCLLPALKCAGRTSADSLSITLEVLFLEHTGTLF